MRVGRGGGRGEGGREHVILAPHAFVWNTERGAEWKIVAVEACFMGVDV